MRGLFVVGVACMGLGCQEYTITDGNRVTGEPNPPPLETVTLTDRITQVTTPNSDVLWIIDNSYSMLDEQTALVNNFESFIQYFMNSGLDWHVGVVSTDMEKNKHSGRLQAASGFTYLDENSPDPVALFTEMASLGTNGASAESGRAATYAALTDPLLNADNKGFYREDAMLSVIVISDEEDSSGNDPISLNEFVSWLGNLKSDEDKLTFSSIVCTEPQKTVNGQKCGTGQFSEPQLGSEYMAVTDAVGGVTWDIRESDWDLVLEDLGMQAAGLKREFFLADYPVPNSINVWVVDSEANGGDTYAFEMGRDYDYDPTRNSITFHTFVPSPLAEVFIEYEPLSAVITSGSADTAGDDTGA